jgi:hypothetical protein
VIASPSNSNPVNWIIRLDIAGIDKTNNPDTKRPIPHSIIVLSDIMFSLFEVYSDYDNNCIQFDVLFSDVFHN